MGGKERGKEEREEIEKKKAEGGEERERGKGRREERE